MREPGLLTAPALPLALIHRTSGKVHSANFACEAFSEVSQYEVLGGNCRETRREDGISRAQLLALVADLDHVLALDDVEPLVLLMVQVPRWSALVEIGDLAYCEAAVGFQSRNLEVDHRRSHLARPNGGPAKASSIPPRVRRAAPRCADSPCGCGSCLHLLACGSTKSTPCSRSSPVGLEEAPRQ
jgi:hypothetical protein